MKKRILIGTLLVFASLALVIGISGCELTLVLFSDIDGKVVNAKASGSSDSWWTDGTYSTYGLEVGLYPENSTGTGFSSTAADTDTVDSTGWYDLGNVSPGRYKLTGTGDSANADWIFVPRIVTLSGSGTVLPTLIAYPNPSGIHDTDVLLFVSWENVNHDLDAYLSYDEDQTDGGRSQISRWNTSSITRDINFYRDIQEAPTTPASYPRVETIIIDSFSKGGPKNDSTAIDPDAIPWNQMRFYVDCYNYAEDSITLTGEEGASPSAWGQVDVMYGNTHYGSWELPYNTAEEVLWVVTIDSVDDDVIDGNFDTNHDYFWIYSAGNANYDIKSTMGSNEGIAIPVTDIN